MDGTVVHYDVTKREGGGSTHQELSVDQLERLIIEAGCKPVERDSLYRRVFRDATTWRVVSEPWSVTYDPGLS
jgi:2-iminoacetate synthase ThiH